MKVGIKSVAAGVITVGYYPDSANLSGVPGTWPASVRDVQYALPADLTIGDLISKISLDVHNFLATLPSTTGGQYLVGRILNF